MKTTELRVGNLIQINNISSETTKVKAVTYVAVFVFDNFIGSPISDVKPIPLTEEWLLNFGFKSKKHDKYGIIYDSGNQNATYVTIKEDKSYLSYFMWDEYLTSIVYVHELQNLHFALTKTELTYRNNS